MIKELKMAIDIKIIKSIFWMFIYYLLKVDKIEIGTFNLFNYD